MKSDEILAQVLELLQREGRVSYRALKIRFSLDNEYLEALKAETIDAKRLAADEDGKVLVWIGETTPAGGQKPEAKAKPATASGGLTPLVGREQEVELLLERWGRAKGKSF
jgi:hypothetical protein